MKSYLYSTKPNHMKTSFILLITILFFSCEPNVPKKATIYTELGEIGLELYEQQAPITTKNFIQYIEGKHYDETKFYRTVTPTNQPNNEIKIEVIQGGISFNDEADIFPPINHESTKRTGIHHLDGTISMARRDTGTVTSEFFICINDQPELDWGGKRNPDLQGFAAFGRVISGMDIVNRIQLIGDENQMIAKPVIIDSIRLSN